MKEKRLAENASLFFWGVMLRRSATEILTEELIFVTY
jgi:hypothetical protein